MGPLGDLIRRHGISFHFFADDSQLYVCFELHQSPVAMSKLEACIREVREWMAANFLNLYSKHQRIDVGSLPSSVTIGDHSISSVQVARNVGAFFDVHLTLEHHISKICKSCYHQLHNIGLIRKFLTPEATGTVVNALVTSRLDGLNALLIGLPQKSLSSLQRVQNCAYIGLINSGFVYSGSAAAKQASRQS